MTYRIDFTRKNNINDTQKEAVFMTTSEKGRVCNFLWAARSRLIDVGGDSVTK